MLLDINDILLNAISVDFVITFNHVSKAKKFNLVLKAINKHQQPKAFGKCYRVVEALMTLANLSLQAHLLAVVLLCQRL